MRAQNILGCAFFLTLFAGLTLQLFGLRRPKGSLEGGRRIGLGLMLCAVALTALGGVSIYNVRTSQQLVIEGNLWGVSTPLQNGASNSFKITDNTGRAVTIRCRYGGPGLREGDRARVHYLVYNNALLDFTMLTGSYTGWHFQEPRGELGYLLWVLMGLVCGFAGFQQLRKRSNIQ